MLFSLAHFSFCHVTALWWKKLVFFSVNRRCESNFAFSTGIKQITFKFLQERWFQSVGAAYYNLILPSRRLSVFATVAENSAAPWRCQKSISPSLSLALHFISSSVKHKADGSPCCKFVMLWLVPSSVDYGDGQNTVANLATVFWNSETCKRVFLSRK